MARFVSVLNLGHGTMISSTNYGTGAPLVIDTPLMQLGLDHMEVYGIRYTLFGLRHRPDFAPSTLHHLNVVGGGEQIA